MRHIKRITNAFIPGLEQNYAEVNTRKELATSQHENLELKQKIKILEEENQQLREKLDHLCHSIELESSQKMEEKLEKEVLDTKRLDNISKMKLIKWSCEV